MNKDIIKTVVWVLGSAAALVGTVISVQAYTDGKYVSKEKQQQYEAVQKVIHTKQYNSNLIRLHGTQLKLSELEISYLEGKEQLSTNEAKKLEFLEETVKYHKVELRDARMRQENPNPEETEELLEDDN